MESSRGTRFIYTQRDSNRCGINRNTSTSVCAAIRCRQMKYKQYIHKSNANMITLDSMNWSDAWSKHSHPIYESETWDWRYALLPSPLGKCIIPLNLDFFFLKEKHHILKSHFIQKGSHTRKMYYAVSQRGFQGNILRKVLLILCIKKHPWWGQEPGDVVKEQTLLFSGWLVPQPWMENSHHNRSCLGWRAGWLRQDDGQQTEAHGRDESSTT